MLINFSFNLMSSLTLFSTGTVSLLSITYIDWPEYIVFFRAYFTLFYILGHLLSFHKLYLKNKSRCFELLVHHYVTCYLILNTVNGNWDYKFRNQIFFLEFSAFMCELSKKFKSIKYISYIYWFYDRLYIYPKIILQNRYDLIQHNLYNHSLVLYFLGLVWSFEMIRLSYYKYILSISVLFFGHLIL